MATGRYSPVTGSGASSSNPSSTSTQGTTTTQGTSNTQGKTQSTTQQNSTNMDPTSLAALQLLIKQLMTGGTDGMKEQRSQKNAEIASLAQQRAGYSKEAAFGDAQGLMALTMRQALEKLMPSINSAAMGSGSSQSSMRALLTQRAAENAAQQASANGLQAAVQYGGVANGMSNVLASLLGQQDPASAALINALNVAKGAVTSTTTNQTGTSSSNQQTSSVGTASEDKQFNYGGVQGSGGGGSLVQYGPSPNSGSSSFPNGREAGQSTASVLQGLVQSANPYSNYSF